MSEPNGGKTAPLHWPQSQRALRASDHLVTISDEPAEEVPWAKITIAASRNGWNLVLQRRCACIPASTWTTAELPEFLKAAVARIDSALEVL